MKALAVIEKTREYLDYLENHILNVNIAWDVLKEKCKDMRFTSDDYVYHSIEAEIFHHDLSKLSAEEFTQYRESFYPCEFEPQKKSLGMAWEYHKEKNFHHWDAWTAKQYGNPYAWEIHCVHMVCDWMAMGYKFDDTAKQYYEKNEDKIHLPDYAVEFIYRIFKRVYDEEKGA